jgi:Ca2+-binding EF-hand superfamily protein
MVDLCRKALKEVRRKHAGYSEKDIDRYRTAFEVYDEDGSGDIERHELTNLLTDLGIPMRDKKEQQQMLEKLDVARNMAIQAGVEEELIGVMGDPSVTFNVLLFLVRMLATAADHAEVDRDREIMEKTQFTPKEAEEFREIFFKWAKKASALDSGQDAPDEKGDTKAGLITDKSGSNDADVGRTQLLTQDGLRRVVRSLGLTMSQQDRKDLDDRIEMGPTEKDNPGKYGFFEFLIFMRWMLDLNFGHINETLALQAVAQSDAPRSDAPA